MEEMILESEGIVVAELEERKREEVVAYLIEVTAEVGKMVSDQGRGERKKKVEEIGETVVRHAVAGVALIGVGQRVEDEVVDGVEIIAFGVLVAFVVFDVTVVPVIANVAVAGVTVGVVEVLVA